MNETITDTNIQYGQKRDFLNDIEHGMCFYRDNMLGIDVEDTGRRCNSPNDNHTCKST